MFFSLHTFWLEHMNKDQSPRIKSWSMDRAKDEKISQVKDIKMSWVFGLSEYRNPAPSERPEKFPIEN